MDWLDWPTGSRRNGYEYRCDGLDWSYRPTGSRWNGYEYRCDRLDRLHWVDRLDRPYWAERVDRPYWGIRNRAYRSKRLHGCVRSYWHDRSYWLSWSCRPYRPTW